MEDDQPAQFTSAVSTTPDVSQRNIFTTRAYVRVVLGVIILSVCLSVTCVHCDKTK